MAVTWAYHMVYLQYMLTPEYLVCRYYLIWTASMSETARRKKITGTLDKQMDVLISEVARLQNKEALMRTVANAQLAYHMAKVFDGQWREIRTQIPRGTQGNRIFVAKARAREALTQKVMEAEGLLVTKKVEQTINNRLKRDLNFGDHLIQGLTAFNDALERRQMPAVGEVLIALLPLREIGKSCGVNDTAQVPKYVVDWVFSQITNSTPIRNFLARLCGAAQKYVSQGTIITRLNYRRMPPTDNDIIRQPDANALNKLTAGKIEGSIAMAILKLHPRPPRTVVVSWESLKRMQTDVNFRQGTWSSWPEHLESVVTLYPYRVTGRITRTCPLPLSCYRRIGNRHIL
jgi:hypothetical protein